MDLQAAIKASIDGSLNGEHDANFKIEVQESLWHVYTVSIAHRAVICYCDKGTATLFIDSYGDRNTYELFDWERQC